MTRKNIFCALKRNVLLFLLIVFPVLSHAALVPVATRVVNEGLSGGPITGYYHFTIDWHLVSVADMPLQNGCHFGLGQGHAPSNPFGVNMAIAASPRPDLYTCNGVASACLQRDGAVYLSCLGEKFAETVGTSGSFTTTFSAGSPMGQDLQNSRVCAAYQVDETATQSSRAFIIPGTCYGFPTQVETVCSIDNTELVLDHGALSPYEVKGHVSELDLRVSCSPSSDNVLAKIQIINNVIFWGSGDIRSTLTVNDQPSLTTVIKDSATFKLKSTLSAPAFVSPGNYNGSTVLVINIL